jgi:putative transposase
MPAAGRRCRSPHPQILNSEILNTYRAFRIGKVIATCLSMRIARRDTICTTGIFHKMWRGHNREHVLESNAEKAAYLEALNDTYKKDISTSIEFHSFVLMGNHVHESGRLIRCKKGKLEKPLKLFGNWMRNANSRFGAGYNRRHDRQGKVAYDRPKTKEAKEGIDMLRVMFYGDSNPVRAGMVSRPSKYRYSTYRFYALGEKNRFTENITPPPEYMELGDTPEKRQRRYRQMCDIYMRKEGLIDDTPDEQVNEPHTVATMDSDSSTSSNQPKSRGDPLNI